jgi:hypothetical protein
MVKGRKKQPPRKHNQERNQKIPINNSFDILNQLQKKRRWKVRIKKTTRTRIKENPSYKMNHPQKRTTKVLL